MMQAGTVVSIANIHPWALADRIQALQHLYIVRIIIFTHEASLLNTRIVYVRFMYIISLLGVTAYNTVFHVEHC